MRQLWHKSWEIVEVNSSPNPSHMLAFPCETVLYFTKTSVSIMVICYIMEILTGLNENCISQWNIRNAHLNYRLKRFMIHFMGHINCQQTSPRCSCSCSFRFTFQHYFDFSSLFKAKRTQCIYTVTAFTEPVWQSFTETILKSMTDVSKTVSCVVQNQSHGWWHKVTKYLNAISGKASIGRTLVLNVQMCLAPPRAV